MDEESLVVIIAAANIYMLKKLCFQSSKRDEDACDSSNCHLVLDLILSPFPCLPRL